MVIFGFRISAPDVRFSFKSEVLASEQSPFQKMVMAENETFGRFFTLNRYVQVTAKDEFVYRDMITHPALAVNPDIKRVLIIGGGDGGTARNLPLSPYRKNRYGRNRRNGSSFMPPVFAADSRCFR